MSDMSTDEQLGRYLERVDGRYWGKHRGLVVDRLDPERLGRLQVKVPSLLADAVTGWAWPATPYAGLFLLPQVGDLVWVEFADGELEHPIWTGCGWGKPNGGSEVPPEAQDAYADTAVLHTPAGNVVVFTDTDGAERITIRSPGGCEVTLDAAARRVTVQANEVVVRDASGDVQPLATKAFVEETFDTHTHMTAAGESNPPTKLPIPNARALTTVLKGR